MKFVLLLLVNVVVVSLLSFGQDTISIVEQKKGATLKGAIVSDSLGTAAANVIVELPSSKMITTTDDLGRFYFEDIHFGSHLLLLYSSNTIADTISLFVNRTIFDAGIIKFYIPEIAIDTVQLHIPVIAMDEQALSLDGDAEQSNLGLFTYSRDPFLSIASFNLAPLNFRLRGYTNNQLEVYMNGVSLNDIEDGNFFATQLGGLNEVLSERNMTYGLQADETYFGGLTGTSSIELNAGAKTKGSRISYANGNRSYRNRLLITHNSGITERGWALSVAASRRWANEGYVAGTSFNSYSFYVGLSKKIGDKGFVHFNTLATPTVNALAAAATQEAMDLTGSVYYNPNWGLQNGEKRSARESDFFQPLMLLHYEYKPNRTTLINLSTAYQFGHSGISSLDWYNAPDPRPDYYQNMPSFWLERNMPMPAVAEAYKQQWLNDESTAQINWDELYDRNSANYETINGVSGRRSRYVLGQDRSDVRKYTFALNVKKEVGEHVSLSGGAYLAMQHNQSYKQLLDLLGGDFYVNLNQFAENQFVGNGQFNQVDLDHPNKIVREGDKYAYHFNSSFKKGIVWMQGLCSFKMLDVFIAARAGIDEFNRDGQYRNGLFPNDSYGKSAMQTFYTYQVKGGFRLKMNAHHALFANAAVMTNPPQFEHTFISPKTRNTLLHPAVVERVKSMELGYVLKSSRWNGRVTAFATDIENVTRVRRFYYEDYTSFVNYAIHGINMRHTGLELALQANITKEFSASLAASYMQVFYTSRPEVSIYRDNDTSANVGHTTVFMKDYHVGVGPQSAYGLGLSYRSTKRWFANVNLNYVERNYIEMNPTRLTAEAVDLLQPETEAWQAIRKQDVLPSVFTIDVFAGKSFSLDKKMKWLNGKTTLAINVGINNILDNKEAIAGSQQLRFDYVDKNPNQFPNKLRYGLGRTYFVNVALQF